MKTSKKGLELIKKVEGVKLQAYLPTKNDVWTIGYGHTKGVKQGDFITEADAHFFLVQDVKWAEDAVLDSVEVPLTQEQFDALVCFVFNVGGSAFRSSTLLKLLNQGKYEAAAKQFSRWNQQKGEVLGGLTARRKLEMELFLA